ncbi:uncharacterized protein UV8b_06943 [Ustilaginoidea virens]|uniref:Tryptophan synthase beta chain-like PALP domain-containing protein n=1 Tax=Ustilaginoidea virens TaxID=1159556 RepID=A0A063CDZ7_USTVR|nr:uncharacterized protein UV8b_06943 [Ustilaginoidea virens]QUC22702.1 hypothetical protein UV8b_06943 [Ustilaginoidea virens]GAO17828.1 hypothetical protein UVI_02011260 [Ustilaginoidea virens]
MPLTYLDVAAQAVQARHRIRSHIYETPLIPSRTNAHRRDGTRLLLKAENLQLTGSFKLRGAVAKMTAPGTAGGDPDDAPLVTASSGNHGIGAAHAARALGRRLTVVLPETVVPAKLRRIEAYGARVVLHGAQAGLAERHARGLAAASSSRGCVYVSPYNDADVVAGQASVGLELLEQCGGRGVDNVFVAMGGGGLVGGVGSVCRAFSPRTRVHGVAAARSMALAASMAAGRVVDTEHLPTLADAVAGGLDDDAITLPLAAAVVDRVVVCDEDEIAAALRAVVLRENMIVEGAAALAYAGFVKLEAELAGQTSVVVLCGANCDHDVVAKTVHGQRLHEMQHPQ